jgi:hypothetical protein
LALKVDLARSASSTNVGIGPAQLNQRLPVGLGVATPIFNSNLALVFGRRLSSLFSLFMSSYYLIVLFALIRGAPFYLR